MCQAQYGILIFQDLLNIVRGYCFQGKSVDGTFLSEQTRHTSCLSFGGLIRAVEKNGKSEGAVKLVAHLHQELGLHGKLISQQLDGIMFKFAY